MKYTVCRNFEWLYPDIKEYKTASDKAEFSALSGSYASFQIFVSDITGDKLSVQCEGAEIYEELAIPVEANPGFASYTEHFPERIAPFEVYDCLKPYNGCIVPQNSIAAIYVAIPVSHDVSELLGNVSLSDGTESADVPYSITVKGHLPEETLQIVMNMGASNYNKYHGAQTKEEAWAFESEYMKLLRRQHQNRLFVKEPFPDRNGNFPFDEFDRFVEKGLRFGYKSFHIGGIGFRKSWDGEEILVNGLDSRSDEGKAFLRLYLGKLREHLKKKGWLCGEMFSIGIADEPNANNAETYNELLQYVKTLIPEIKLYDAVSDASIDISLDIWIPRSDEFERNIDMFEKRRADGGEIWQYICLFPRDGGYINRFMDIPLLGTRYIYWGNYLYDMRGLLHWTVDDYQGEGIPDPFSTSCPVHRNADSVSILPPGDDKLIYPGNGGPWMSIRFENLRESAEEYEMLRSISEKNKKAADELCRRGLRKFNDAELDPCAFAKIREDLIDTYVK